MIIFNEKEYYNHFFEKNDRMLNIESEKSLEELYQMLLQGEDISSVARITGLKGFKNNRSGVQPMTEHTTLLANSMTSLLDFNDHMPDRDEYAVFDENDAHEEATRLTQETIRIQNTRPDIFFDNECKTFNLALKHYDSLVPWEDYQKEDLILEIGDALGIMPNLQKPEIPFEEQKHLSIVGKELYLPGNVVAYTSYNNLPTYEEMKYYDNLPRVQKDFLRPEYDKLKLHPLFLLNLIKTKYNGLINEKQLDEDEYSYKREHNSFHYSNNHYEYTLEQLNESVTQKKAQAEEEIRTSCGELLTETDNLFKEQFHGRSPRVLNTLVSGYKKVYPDVKAETIVSEFNQQNVSKVAKYNNETLLVLSGIINFNNIKESHIPILGSCIPISNVKRYLDSNFFSWYKKNAGNITDNDLAFITSNANKINTFEVDMTIKEAIDQIKNYQGYKDMKLFEEKYHYKFSDNLVAIRGRNIVCKDNNYTMYMLKADDIRNFTVGYDTHCCQHYGNAGSTCVMKLTREPFAGVTVIEKNGKVIGQAFVWTDEDKDTFVFDNMEFANDADIALYESVIAEYVKQLPYENVHIGSGYLAGGMAGWGNRIQSSQFAQMPTLICNDNIYTDYHSSNARVLKDNGRVLIHPEHSVNVTLTPIDNTNKLLEPDNIWALQIHGKTMEEKIKILDEIADIDSWPVTKQLEWVQSAPTLIKKIENPPAVVQTWVADNYPKYIQYIKHPVPALIERRILAYPESIDKIIDENADFILTEDFCNRLLSDHPSILKKLFELNALLDSETIKGVIRQNPYNVRTFPNRYLTDEIKRYAVELEPKLATLLDVPQSTLLRAASLNPNIGALMDEIPNDVQITMVQTNSSSINNIKHPCREAVEIAISDNPLLIRNYQHDYPDLIPNCIMRNNSVINVIKHPSAEMFSLLNGYVPTNPYIKRDFLAWQREQVTQREVAFER